MRCPAAVLLLFSSLAAFTAAGTTTTEDDVRRCYAEWIKADRHFGSIVSIQVGEDGNNTVESSPLEETMSSLRCSCGTSLEEAGFTEGSFMSMPAVFVGIFIYNIAVFIADLELHKMPSRVRYVFYPFTLFRLGTSIDIEEMEKKAVVLSEGVDTAKAIRDRGEAKSDQDAVAMAKARFKEQLRNAWSKNPDQRSVLKVEQEAEPGPRKWLNLIVLSYNIFCMLFAAISFWSAPVSCYGVFGKFSYALATFLYKPFFVPLGSILLMTNNDLMFGYTGMPGKLSPLPDVGSFIAWWLILMPSQAFMSVILFIYAVVTAIVMLPATMAAVVMFLLLELLVLGWYYSVQLLAHGLAHKKAEEHLKQISKRKQFYWHPVSFLAFCNVLVLPPLLIAQVLMVKNFIKAYFLDTRHEADKESFWYSLAKRPFNRQRTRLTSNVPDLQDSRELVRLVEQEWSVFNIGAHGWPLSAWMGHELRCRTKTGGFINRMTWLNDGCGCLMYKMIQTIATPMAGGHFKRFDNGESGKFVLRPLLFDEKTTFTSVYKVQVVLQFSMLIWVGIAGGKLFSYVTVVGDDIAAAWYDAAVDTMRWWYPQHVWLSISWPRLPELVMGKISFALSLSALCLNIAVNILTRFCADPAGLSKIAALVGSLDKVHSSSGSLVRPQLMPARHVRVVPA